MFVSRPWWPLLSAPAEYEEEASQYADALERHGDRPLSTLLELGSGGGNNAWWMKRRFGIRATWTSSFVERTSTRPGGGSDPRERAADAPGLKGAIVMSWAAPHYTLRQPAVTTASLHAH